VTNTITYENIPYSQIYGLEFQYQQQYTSLPDFLSDWVARVHFQDVVPGRDLAGNYTELPSQSDLIFNTGVFYKKDGLTIDVGGSFTARTCP